MNFTRKISRVACGLLLCVGCGSGDSDTDSMTDATTAGTVGTAGTASSTTPGTTSETEGETDPTGSETAGETSTSDSPTTDGPTTDDPTTTTDGPTTDDPSVGSDSDSDTTDGGGSTYCLESCEQDADCNLNGQNQGFTCGDDSLCTSEAGLCSTDVECQILYSGWEAGDNCAAQDDCALTQGCIDLNGVGKCVYIPSDFITCEGINQEEIPMPAIEGGTMTVCGNTTAYCTDDNYCLDGCSSNADCFAPGYPICNTDTNRCECGQDSDCTDQAGASVCNDGICQCAIDDDCLDLDNADACYDGVCGCSSEMVCEGYVNSFDGTTVSCRGI